jgi:hypothetical protein
MGKLAREGLRAARTKQAIQAQNVRDKAERGLYEIA